MYYKIVNNMTPEEKLEDLLIREKMLVKHIGFMETGILNAKKELKDLDRLKEIIKKDLKK